MNVGGLVQLLIPWICLDYFVLNGTDRALERHNIPRTAPRRTSKCEFHRESCMSPPMFSMHALAHVCCHRGGCVRFGSDLALFVAFSAAIILWYIVNISQLGHGIKARTHYSLSPYGMGQLQCIPRDKNSQRRASFCFMEYTVCG